MKFVYGLSILFAVSIQGLYAQDFLRDLVTQSPGPLSEAHEDYDHIQQCIQCHESRLGGEVDNTKCYDCHDEIRVRLEQDWGYHWNKANCASCHIEHQGRDGYVFGPEDWQETFDHDDTGYALLGAHQSVECHDCHDGYRTHYETGEQTETRTYLDAPIECIECHEDVYEHDFRDTELLDCTYCHSSSIDSWKTMARDKSFDHDSTAYPLEGFHEGVECSECHTPDPELNRVTTFQPLPFGQCTDCHSDPHEGSFGDRCTDCHSVYREWNDVYMEQEGIEEGFDHDQTNFPLEGFHQAVDCSSCHYKDDGSFDEYPAGSYDTCSDCHGFPHGEQFQDQACESCHAYEQRFTESSFTVQDHLETDFPLDGKHQVISCQKCHYGGEFEDLAFEECSDCHRNAHPDRQIDHECSFCHVTTTFSWIQFDHNRQTDFRLTGEHRDVACLSCHVDEVFKNMPASNENPNCQACHADPHGPGMPNECADCHSTNGFHFSPDFDHGEIADWALEGRHQELSCQKCHPDHLLADYSIPLANQANLQTDCINCHIDIHKGDYGSDCQSCHNTTSFDVPYEEQVHDLGYFQLKGVHDDMECTDCHAPHTNLQGTGAYCAWCHEKDDIHLGQMGPECQDCHSQTSWLPPRFKHNTTGFRLTGAHRYAECSSCHINQTYQGLPNDCYFCHSDQYLSPDVVEHHSPGIVDCAQCHSTIDWNIRTGSGIGL